MSYLLRWIIIYNAFLNAQNQMYMKALSIALGFINIFIAPELPQLSSATFSLVFTFGFLFLIGVLIRKGFDWMKYVLLAMMVFGMLAS
ncbi:hypothetical protein GCM10011418_11520 [Sphingobacterium alkalisoli]|nr:hypothetical protein GCM10011418_11520 [Sphingobacterium alkalisoli]